jgi:hypothetical protein
MEISFPEISDAMWTDSAVIVPDALMGVVEFVAAWLQLASKSVKIINPNKYFLFIVTFLSPLRTRPGFHR